MATPTTVDEYLVALPRDQRVALQELRETIAAAAPGATETISYQMPAFKLDGRFLVSFAAFKDHCSFFPASTNVIKALGEQLKPYLSGKGTMRFTVDAPIPSALVRKVVRARIAENAAKARRGRR
jgi:uncharacterized protein YdhG (YjbR/CyaY superfamily)